MRLFTNDVARICHEVNDAIRDFLGEDSRPSWDLSSAQVKESVLFGVETLNARPELTPEDMHTRWVGTKKSQGWKYGKILDEGKKTHPNMVAYDKLSSEQQLKDIVFHAIVKALR